MLWQPLFLLCLTLLLTACGNSDKIATRKRTTISPQLMEQIMNEQSFDCYSGDGCHEGIGRLFAINYSDADNSSKCSAFLVAPDLVLTNSHCVYAGIRNLKRSCEGLYFIFPTKWGTIHQARCSKILYRDPHQNGNPRYQRGDQDFALIRLDRELRLSHLELNEEGLKPLSIVHPYVIDHISDFTARMVKLSCEMTSVDSTLGVAELSNCPVISGNSGSAVLDQNDRVVGVIFASSNPTIRKETDPLYIRKHATTKAYAFDLAFIMKKLGRFLNDESAP